MKKLLLLVAGFILFSSLHAQSPSITIGNVQADGSQAIVPVSVSNVTDIVGFEFRMQYDSDKLEFINIQDFKLPGSNYRAEYVPEQNILFVNWVNLSIPILGTSPTGKIFELVFKFTGTEVTPIEFIVATSRLINTALANVPNVNFVNGSVSPDPADGFVEMTQLTALTGGHFLMPVTFQGQGFTSVTNFTLLIEYDQAAFDFVGVTAATGITGVTASASGGVITITRTGGAVNLSAPTLVLDIRMLNKSSVTNTLTFRQTSTVNSTLGQRLVKYKNGQVSSTATGANLRMNDVNLFVPNINPAGTPLAIPIVASGFTFPVADISLVVPFNNQQLTYTGFTAQQLTDWNVTLQGNQLLITWKKSQAQAIGNGSLITLNFTYSGPVSSNVSFGATSVMRASNLGSLPVTYTGASVVVSNVSYQLTLQRNPTAGGTVTGANNYPQGAVASINAIPAAGYVFVNWTYPNGDVFSTAAATTITMTRNETLVANFEKPEYTVTLQASPAEGGAVTGSGTYFQGDLVSIEAVSAGGYEFINWTDSEGVVFSETAKTTFTMPGKNLDLTANFDARIFKVEILVSPLNSGIVTGAGTYLLGQEVTVTAEPLEGYKFVNWSNLQGVEMSDNPVFVFTMTASDLLLVANFVRVFSVTFNVDMQYVDGYFHKYSFNAATDKVFVTGDMFEWAEPGIGLASEHMKPAKSAAQIYSITLLLEPAEYEYKYYINPGSSKPEWDGDPFRKFFVTNSNLVINDWFGSLTNPLGTDIGETVSQVSIYPNPAKDKLHIESSSFISEVRLVDMLGQVVRNVPVREYQVQLDVSDLNGGIYFIQVLSSEGMQVQRVQILN